MDWLWKWAVDHAQDEWRVMSGAPGFTILVVVIVTAGMFAIFKWRYQSIFDQKDAAIGSQQTVITNLNSTISDLRSQIASLRETLAEGKAKSPDNTAKAEEARSPDGIYQLGARVGRVVGARIDKGNSTVFFDNLVASSNFNPHSDFEYMDMVLHLRKMARSGKTVTLDQVWLHFAQMECALESSERTH